MTTDPTTLTCTVTVAGLSLSLTGNAALMAALRARYTAFDDDRGADLDHASSFSIGIELTGRAPRATDDRPLTFRAGNAYFTAPDYYGEIDLVARRGALTLNSARPIEDVDYFVRAVCALGLFKAGGLLFHAAGLQRGERGYLFFGPSGSGKTTVARLSPAAIVLNDDLVALHLRDGQWRMHSTPFSNPTQNTPTGPYTVAVSAAYRLIQDRSVYIENLPSALAVAELVASCPIVCADPARTPALLMRARQIQQAVPVRRLHFLPDASFWRVVDAA